jgi:hypothetical protein
LPQRCIGPVGWSMIVVLIFPSPSNNDKSLGETGMS